MRGGTAGLTGPAHRVPTPGMSPATDLHRDQAVVPEIVREVDGCHAACTELTLDAVAVGERRRKAFGSRCHEGKMAAGGLDRETDSGERIGPAQVREPGEIRVGRAKLGAMFDRQGCQMRVSR